MGYPKTARWGVWTLATGAAVVLALSIIFTPETLPGVGGCGFRMLTGLPCPGCGLTRAFCAISHGHFADAWGFNPFGFIFYALTLSSLFAPWISRRFPQLLERFSRSSAFIWAPLGLVVAMWIFGLCRIVYLWRG
jgi:hypothetical protein